MEKLIAKKYARALMESGDDAAVSKRLEVLEMIGEVLTDAEIKTFITSPLIAKEQKTEWLLGALKGSKDTVVSNLIKLMGEKGRLDLIPELVAIVAFERKKASNRFEGVVYSDENLSKGTLSTLEKTLARYSGATIHLDQQHTGDAGLKVEVEDLGIELSFSRDKVKRALIDHIQKAL